MLEEGLEILLRREMRLPTGNEKVSHAGFPEKNQWERRRAIRTERKVSVIMETGMMILHVQEQTGREPLGRGCAPAERMVPEDKSDSRSLRTTNHPQQLDRSVG